MTPEAVACGVLYAEAECLDGRRWDDWLALFTADCTFWVPSWISDEEMCTDPARQVSLIYYDSRSGLEERVSRIRSRRSIASLPMPRTVHAVTNVMARPAGEGRIAAKAAWSVDVFSVKD